jgi:hypothetical protein
MLMLDVKKIKGSVSFGTYKTTCFYTKKFETMSAVRMYFDDNARHIPVCICSEKTAQPRNAIPYYDFGNNVQGSNKEDIIPEYMYPFNNQH